MWPLTSHLACGVVGRESAKLIFSGLMRPTQVPKVFSLPTVPAMISWKSILTERKKCFGRLEQWKQTALLGSLRSCCSNRGEQRRSFRGQAQGMHAQNAADIPLHRHWKRRLSLIMLMIVHGTTPRFSSMEVQHCTALIANFRRCHPLVDDRAKFSHLHQGDFWDAAGVDVFLDRGEASTGQGRRCLSYARYGLIPRRDPKVSMEIP